MAAKDLITLEEYKTYAGITSTAQNAIINALIPGVSELTKNYCRRRFIDYNDTATTQIASGGSERIILDEWPLIGTATVTCSADYGATTTTLVPGVDYVVDLTNSELVTLSSSGYFPKYISGYRITYMAGFAQVPTDLKLAVMDLLKYYMKNDGAIHSGRSAGANALQIEYILDSSLPAHIKRVFDLYVANYL